MSAGCGQVARSDAQPQREGSGRDGVRAKRFRCNTCELTPGPMPGLKITIFYVATQLATEHFPWYYHTFVNVKITKPF